MTLPKPSVSVTTSQDGSTGRHDVTITASRESGKEQAWTGSGPSSSEAIKGAVEKMLGDSKTAELLP